jgi:hypothetical protein
MRMPMRITAAGEAVPMRFTVAGEALRITEPS